MENHILSFMLQLHTNCSVSALRPSAGLTADEIVHPLGGSLVRSRGNGHTANSRGCDNARFMEKHRRRQMIGLIKLEWLFNAARQKMEYESFLETVIGDVAIEKVTLIDMLVLPLAIK